LGENKRAENFGEDDDYGEDQDYQDLNEDNFNSPSVLETPVSSSSMPRKRSIEEDSTKSKNSRPTKRGSIARAMKETPSSINEGSNTNMMLMFMQMNSEREERERERERQREHDRERQKQREKEKRKKEEKKKKKRKRKIRR
jgi:hypothetical protein